MKKLVLISVMAFSVLLLVGCGKKTVTVDETLTETTTTTETVEATKDQCLELVAYGMEVALAQGQGDTAKAVKLAEEASALEEQYTANNVEFEWACEKYMTDPEFIQAVQEFMKKLQ